MLVLAAPFDRMLIMSSFFSCKRTSWLCPPYLVLVAIFVLISNGLLSAQTTNEAPVTPSTYQPEDFGHYLAEHQEALRPVFYKYAPEWSHEAFPIFVNMEAPVLAVLLTILFFLDLVLGRLYAAYFAPAQATLRHSFYFALCNLVQIIISLVIFFVLVFLAVQNIANGTASALYLLLGFLVLLASLLFYVVLIVYFYRTGVMSALGLMILFISAAIIINIPACFIILPIYHKTTPHSTMVDFINNNVSPKILVEAEASKTAYATAEQSRFNIQKQVDENQAKIYQIQSQTAELQKKITDWLQSDSYALSQIGPIRSRGDLLQAEKAYQDFLTKFPTSSYDDLVKTQLTEVSAAYAAQQLAQQQAATKAAQDAAAYQASLLERVKTNGVSLSELHQFLLGKSREQVKELFGSPTETASDRWGYSQVIAMNPMTNQKYGLAITFEEGVVQSLDYYYGGAQPTSPATNTTPNPANTSQ